MFFNSQTRCLTQDITEAVPEVQLSWPDPTAAPLPADRTAGNCAVSSLGPGTHSPIPHQIHKYKED